LLQQREKTKGIQQMSQSYRLKFKAIDQAQQAISSLIGSKTGLTKENAPNIINLLRQAGATSLAKDIEDQTKSVWVNYGLGSYMKPENLQNALKAYKQSYQDAFRLNEQGETLEEGEPTEEPTEPGAGEPMEGDVFEWGGRKMEFQGGDPGNKANYRDVGPAAGKP
jgi:hypothetical protein